MPWPPAALGCCCWKVLWSRGPPLTPLGRGLPLLLLPLPLLLLPLHFKLTLISCSPPLFALTLRPWGISQAVNVHMELAQGPAKRPGLPCKQISSFAQGDVRLRPDTHTFLQANRFQHLVWLVLPYTCHCLAAAAALLLVLCLAVIAALMLLLKQLLLLLPSLLLVLSSSCCFAAVAA